jgi:hypothetical protein
LLDSTRPNVSAWQMAAHEGHTIWQSAAIALRIQELTT